MSADHTCGECEDNVSEHDSISDSNQDAASDLDESSECEEGEPSGSNDSHDSDEGKPVIDHYMPDGVRSLWEQDQLFDYTIQVEGKAFRLHKVILASSSPRFQATIKKGAVQRHESCLKLGGITAVAMENLIQFIYTNNMEVTKQNVDEVLQAAKYFRMQSAVEMCTNFKANKQGLDSEVDEPLVDRIHSLWEEDQLFDFTITVEDQQFYVHKVIMAAMSNYSRNMLTSAMTGSRNNTVNINEVSSATVETLVDFIYTHDLDLITQNEDVAELLSGAVYLQIPMAIEVCSKFLVCHLNEENWLDSFQRMRSYGLNEALEDVKLYIRMYMDKIVKTCDLKQLSREDLFYLIDNWQDSEYGLFLFIRRWVNADLQSREQIQNDTLCRVRYGLMTPKELGRIQGMKDFSKNSKNSWCQLIDMAIEYHKLPICRRVLDSSEQTQVRGDPTFVIFSSGDSENGGFIYEPHREATFVPQIGIKAPKGLKMTLTDIEINNFLVVLCFPEKQGPRCWCIFDPRTRQWGPMANLPEDLCALSLAHDNKYIYAPGGLTENEQIIDRIDRYDFQTDRWRPFGRLAVPIRAYSTCIVNGGLYVSGGLTEDSDDDPEASCLTRMDSLDLSTRKWQKKAAMLEGRYDHTMHVMTILGEEVVCIIEYKMALQYYSPTRDQWFRCPFVFNSPAPQMEHHALVRGNSVYLMNACAGSGSSKKTSNAVVTYSENKKEAAVKYLFQHEWRISGLMNISVLSICPNTQPTPSIQTKDKRRS